ncbi:hypothetical protein COT75_02985 [Candidatus Beckwithbacteria bacterium CG10_big_fil_rev_8_21_14_0_10_34_10]|uniref:Spore coat biosynthesis protein F n=1 Tax=Candidatus Beckwithbacteria bacterium CG10_big_fil_rev_8_21_14_0_10_34_10 TaxID=1974495 RepID=A0A2H0W958_9BACT|nr:MAG: hypothetical protein COT75_02985 [Candidatus Beckwithbacteria bacterium CG10_big_fil_rev_8_21_14_0_10_34_10]
MNKKIVCTIEARMGSSRLPGKVLMSLAGEPALKRMIDRIKKSKYINEIIVATTINKKDNKIVDFCKSYKIKFYRGSENDVLRRILEAAKASRAKIVVVLTGDCPLIDFRHIDEAIEVFLEGKYNYISNALERSYPDGFDVQVLSLEVLEKIDKLANDPIERVHSTYYIYRHPEEFKIKNIKAKGKMYWPNLRVTLDEINDYKLINILFKNLLPKDPFFSAKKVVEFLLKNPKFLKINQKVRHKKTEEG